MESCYVWSIIGGTTNRLCQCVQIQIHTKFAKCRCMKSAMSAKMLTVSSQTLVYSLVLNLRLKLQCPLLSEDAMTDLSRRQDR